MTDKKCNFTPKSEVFTALDALMDKAHIRTAEIAAYYLESYCMDEFGVPAGYLSKTIIVAALRDLADELTPVKNGRHSREFLRDVANLRKF